MNDWMKVRERERKLNIKLFNACESFEILLRDLIVWNEKKKVSQEIVDYNFA